MSVSRARNDAEHRAGVQRSSHGSIAASKMRNGCNVPLPQTAGVGRTHLKDVGRLTSGKPARLDVIADTYREAYQVPAGQQRDIRPNARVGRIQGE
jgi:hypothetical protein